MGRPNIHLKVADKKALFLIAFNALDAKRTYACRDIGLSVTTLYKWLEQDADFKEKFDKIEKAYWEGVLDKSEQVVVDSATKVGNTKDAKWLLGKKGRERGYGEKGIVGVQVNANFAGMQFPEEPKKIEEFERLLSVKVVEGEGDGERLSGSALARDIVEGEIVEEKDEDEGEDDSEE